MVRAGFIAASMLAIVSCAPTPKTTVKLHIDGKQGEASPMVVTKDSTYRAALDSAGTAVFVLAENLKPGYAQVKYGRVVLPVYVENGKSFDVSILIEGRQVTPKFSGEGAKKNDYLNNKALQRFFPDFKLGEEEFMAALDKQKESFYATLDSMGFDGAFNQLEKKRLHYQLYSMLSMYPSYHAYYAQDDDYTPSEKYYGKLKADLTEEEALIDMPEYRSALASLVRTFAMKDMESYDGLNMTKNALAYVDQNIKSPVLTGYLVDEFLTSYVENAGVDHLDEFAGVYESKVTDPEKKKAFGELCGKWAKIAKGQPSPDFKYLNIDGQEVSLADLAGKYVYIDVWATWCGPCRGELPHLKELEHKFAKKNIHFVSISCDQDKAAWEKMVKEDKLGGIQLHAGQDEAFMDAYMIRGIPRFILLDREGKILAADMTRPSNPKTVETLNALEGI